MTGGNINFQDALLLDWQKEASPVRMTMINGTVIDGVVKRFDRFSVVLEADGREVLIYKHAIAMLEKAGEG